MGYGAENKNQEKEDRILMAGIEDRMRQSEERYMITNSHFLDMRQRSMAEKLSRSLKGPDFAFYGGYPDAERVIEVFFPEGFMEGGSAEEHFRRIPRENPLTVIRAELKRGTSALSHRDYLGALMGLGIKREMTGDILVRNDGADLIVLKEIADFLLLNYMKAGRANLSLSEVPVQELRRPQRSRVEIAESVASLRLDNVVSAAFRLSRSAAAEAIVSGAVFVDGLGEKKPDRQVREGEKIVLRGKGRTVLLRVGDQNRKGRIRIILERYE